MDARHVTPVQAEVIYKRLRPQCEYLADLQNRMEALDWDRTDRLYLEVKTARDAIQLLCNEAHAILCRSWMPQV